MPSITSPLGIFNDWSLDDTLYLIDGNSLWKLVNNQWAFDSSLPGDPILSISTTGNARQSTILYGLTEYTKVYNGVFYAPIPISIPLTDILNSISIDLQETGSSGLLLYQKQDSLIYVYNTVTQQTISVVNRPDLVANSSRLFLVYKNSNEPTFVFNDGSALTIVPGNSLDPGIKFLHDPHLGDAALFADQSSIMVRNSSDIFLYTQDTVYSNSIIVDPTSGVAILGSSFWQIHSHNLGFSTSNVALCAYGQGFALTLLTEKAPTWKWNGASFEKLTGWNIYSFNPNCTSGTTTSAEAKGHSLNEISSMQLKKGVERHIATVSPPNAPYTEIEITVPALNHGDYELHVEDTTGISLKTPYLIKVIPNAEIPPLQKKNVYVASPAPPVTIPIATSTPTGAGLIQWPRIFLTAELNDNSLLDVLCARWGTNDPSHNTEAYTPIIYRGTNDIVLNPTWVNSSSSNIEEEYPVNLIRTSEFISDTPPVAKMKANRDIRTDRWILPQNVVFSETSKTMSLYVPEAGLIKQVKIRQPLPSRASLQYGVNTSIPTNLFASTIGIATGETTALSFSPSTSTTLQISVPGGTTSSARLWQIIASYDEGENAAFFPISGVVSIPDAIKDTIPNTITCVAHPAPSALASSNNTNQQDFFVIYKLGASRVDGVVQSGPVLFEGITITYNNGISDVEDRIDINASEIRYGSGTLDYATVHRCRVPSDMSAGTYELKIKYAYWGAERIHTYKTIPLAIVNIPPLAEPTSISLSETFQNSGDTVTISTNRALSSTNTPYLVLLNTEYAAPYGGSRWGWNFKDNPPDFSNVCTLIKGTPGSNSISLPLGIPAGEYGAVVLENEYPYTAGWELGYQYSDFVFAGTILTVKPPTTLKPEILSINPNSLEAIPGDQTLTIRGKHLAGDSCKVFLANRDSYYTERYDPKQCTPLTVLSQEHSGDTDTITCTISNTLSLINFAIRSSLSGLVQFSLFVDKTENNTANQSEISHFYINSPVAIKLVQTQTDDEIQIQETMQQLSRQSNEWIARTSQTPNNIPLQQNANGRLSPPRRKLEEGTYEIRNKQHVDNNIDFVFQEIEISHNQPILVTSNTTIAQIAPIAPVQMKAFVPITVSDIAITTDAYGQPCHTNGTVLNRLDIPVTKSFDVLMNSVDSKEVAVEEAENTNSVSLAKGFNHILLSGE